MDQQPALGDFLATLVNQQREMNNKINALLDWAGQVPVVYPHEDAPYIGALRQALAPANPIGAVWTRIGGENDGGYVMVDRGLDNTAVYNFGIGNEVTWDNAMASRGNMVYQFDHTIDAAPAVTGLAYFQSKGLGITSHGDFVSLHDALEANGDAGRRDLVLNIDIEGGEWEILNHLAADELVPFSQIVMELHGLLRTLDDPAFRDQVHSALSALTESHQVVHVHANNWAARAVSAGILAYDVLEVTLVRRGDWMFEPCRESFPRALDRPNCAHRPEYRLGNWAVLPDLA